MSKALLCLVLLAVCGFTDIYQNCDGWIFSETALLSEPSQKADTLAVFYPGISVALFGRSSLNSQTLDCCEVVAISKPGTVGFVRTIDLALTSHFDSSTQAVLMYGFSDSGELADTSITIRLARGGMIVNSATFSFSMIDAQRKWDYSNRGQFIRIDESGFENVSAAYILHFPEIESEYCHNEAIVFLREDSTIVSGPCLSSGCIDDLWYTNSYFVTPEETSADNTVSTVVIARQSAIEADDPLVRDFIVYRSLWNGNQFEEKEPIVLSLPEDTSSYLTQDDLEPFNCQPGIRIREYQILGYPESLLPPGAEELRLIPVAFSSEPTDFTSIIIAFSYPEGWLPLDTLLSPGTTNLAKLYGRWMEETETLLLYPYGTMSSSYPISTWSRNNEWKFNLISDEIHDAAAVAYPAMDSLLAEGNIQEAYEWLNYILMSRMGQRAHAEMAVQFFYSAVSASFQSTNGMEPLEQANRACGLMNMANWFIEIPSMGRDAYLESQFAQYINIGSLQEGLGYLRNRAEAQGDSLYAAELENAINSLNTQRE